MTSPRPSRCSPSRRCVMLLTLTALTAIALAALALVAWLYEVAASLAQGLFASVWQSQRGALLKALAVHPSTGNFTGVFVSGPAATCPGVPYDLAGRVRGSRVVFRTARDWTPDLQSDHGLVWTLCQPDDRCHKRYRHIRCAKRPRGKGARHGSFPAHLNLGAMRQISRSAGSG